MKQWHVSDSLYMLLVSMFRAKNKTWLTKIFWLTTKL